MAKYLSNIDLNKNELQNPVIHPLGTAPGTPVEGQIYYDSTTGDKHIYLYNGTAWVQLSEGAHTTDYVSNVSLSGTDLTFTGVGNAFNGTVDLSSLDEIVNDSTITIVAGDYLSTGGSFTLNQATNASITINHDATSRADTTSTDAPGYGGTFEAVTSVTTNTYGHVTAIDVSTVTIPASDNTDNYVDSVSFNTGSGVLTLGRTGALADLTQDLDGRYLELSGGTMTGDIAMGSNSITGLVDPTNAQDAATKAYVDNLVDGGLTFKDGFNATTGAIDGGGNLTSGGSRVAISVGDYYVVTTAGDFYGDSSYPLTVGDSVIAKEDAAAGASTVTDWVIIQGDEGVVDLTSGNGGTSTGNALTSNTNARGSVTVNSFAYGGTTNVGHVPAGGSATTFLRGDGTWVTPTDTQPPVDDVTASTNDTLLGISVSPTTGNVVVGLDINGLTDDQLDEAPSSYDVVVYNDADAINRKLNLEDLASHINSVTSKAYTISDTATITYPFTLTAATQNDTIIQLVDTVTNETVYADVDRISTTQATITFASTPTNDIRVLVQKIG